MLGINLKELRARASLSQSEMAVRLGMSLRSYQDLEGGAAEMRELHRLAVGMASLNLSIELRRADLALREAAEVSSRFQRLAEAQGNAMSDWQGDEAHLDSYLAEIKKLLPLPMTVKGRVNDYGFRWEVAIMLVDGPVIIGNWPKGQRPQPHAVAMAVVARVEKEVEARRLYVEEKPPGTLQIPWEEAPEFAKNSYRQRAGVPASVEV